MTNIDQFESVFKAATKDQFQLEAIDFRHVVCVTDMDRAASDAFCQKIQAYLDVISPAETRRLTVIPNDDYDAVDGLLMRLAELGPDLVFTYRNLHIPANEHPYSLGVYLDVLTQATRLPILVFPRPNREWEPRQPALKTVMAITDHLPTADHLISVAAHCTRAEGTLWLTHVEDRATMERYLKIIEKIPELNSDLAHEAIPRQLLKEPHDYIASCRQRLEDAQRPITISEEITLGKRLAEYRRLIDNHHVDLLVMNTKDDEQLAMHGLAYPLTVELREIPLLLL